MNAFIQTLRNLGPTRLAIIGGAGIMLVAFFIYLMTRIGGPDMQLLFADLTRDEVARVTQRLDAAGIPNRPGNDGASVLAPAADVSRARVLLAAEGLPQQGSIGFELFDQNSGLNTGGSFQQQINQQRALQGELQRTIENGITGVRSARVHLVMPQRELFTRERQEPSASVALRMQGSQRLAREQVIAIQNLIAFAVPQLQPHRVQVIDERGSLLSGAVDPSNPALASSNNENARIAYEQRLKLAIESMIDRLLGPNMTRAEVTAQLDFSRVSENIERFNPDEQVVRSTQTVAERNENRESDTNPSVTVANNLPTAQAGGQGQGGVSQSSLSTRQEETTNFEISRTIQNVIRETGGVQRLSVAVAVDHRPVPPADGANIPVARWQREALSQQDLRKIEELVRSAIGFNAQRGDEVRVETFRFWDEEAIQAAQQSLLDRISEPGTLIRLAEILALGLVGALVLLLVVRPLIGRLFEAIPSAATPAAAAAMLGAPGMAPALAGPGGARLPGVDIDVNDSIEEMIDLNRIEGRVKASSLRKIGEIVEKHPEDVVAIIRNWLYMEAN